MKTRNKAKKNDETKEPTRLMIALGVLKLLRKFAVLTGMKPCEIVTAALIEYCGKRYDEIVALDQWLSQPTQPTVRDINDLNDLQASEEKEATKNADDKNSPQWHVNSNHRIIKVGVRMNFWLFTTQHYMRLSDSELVNGIVETYGGEYAKKLKDEYRQRRTAKVTNAIKPESGPAMALANAR